MFPCDFTNGNTSGYSLQPSAAVAYISDFNLADFKGVGGDVEVYSPCGDIDYNVGNYVWIDIDGDGEQDPEENPVTDFIVKIYTKNTDASDSELIATTRTDEQGEYYFTNSESDSEIWEAGYDNLEKGEDYYIVFCGDSYNSNTDAVASGGVLFSLTTNDTANGPNADQIDSDATELVVPGIGELPAICFTLDSTDYTLDLGLTPKPDVALSMIFDPTNDASGLKFGDPVKFNIRVYNQSLLNIDSLSIVDYVPLGFSFDPELLGNENWTTDDNGNPTIVLSSPVLSEEADSVCIYLNLQEVDNPLDWINSVSYTHLTLPTICSV